MIYKFRTKEFKGRSISTINLYTTDAEEILKNTLDKIDAISEINWKSTEKLGKQKINILSHRDTNLIGGVVFAEVKKGRDFRASVYNLHKAGFSTLAIMATKSDKHRAIGYTKSKDIYDKYLETLGIYTKFKVETYNSTYFSKRSIDRAIYLVIITNELVVKSNRRLSDVVGDNWMQPGCLLGTDILPLNECLTSSYEKVDVKQSVEDNYMDIRTAYIIGSVVIKGGKIEGNEIGGTVNLYLIDTDISDIETISMCNSHIQVLNCKTKDTVKYYLNRVAGTVEQGDKNKDPKNIERVKVLKSIPEDVVNIVDSVHTNLISIPHVVANTVGVNRATGAEESYEHILFNTVTLEIDEDIVRASRRYRKAQIEMKKVDSRLQSPIVIYKNGLFSNQSYYKTRYNELKD